jgi:ABC-type transport system involved in multi-copper enzyme maturation permease subunit
MFRFGNRADTPGKRRRKDRGRMLGPVFWYDLVRTSRHGQVIGHRLLYAGLLFFVLAMVYWNRFPNFTIGELIHGQPLSLAQRAGFAASFFQGFLILQFVVVLLLTPLYTAGAIAEEKERRTLELLFVTDLSSREIVLGTLASRLARLFLLLLTGLPILIFLGFLGGLDLNWVLAGFVASFMLMLSLGSISILASVDCRTALGAVFTSYLTMVLLAVLGVCMSGFLFEVYDPTYTGTITQGLTNKLLLFFGLLIFSLVHCLIALICCGTAIAHVRPSALRALQVTRGEPDRFLRVEPKPIPVVFDDATDPGWGPSPEVTEPGVQQRVSTAAADNPPDPRPPIGANSLLWKEMHVEPNFGRTSSMQLLAFFWIGVLLLLILLVGRLSDTGPASHYAAHVQSWVRGLGIACGFVLFLIVALSAANRVTRERERQTLDSLLTLPYSDSQVLFAKLLGSILNVRRFSWILLGLWVVGLLTGGVSLVAFPMLIASFVVYLVFFASLGLWFSTMYGSSLRANLFTLLTALVILTGPLSMLSSASSIIYVTGSAPDLLLWPPLLVEFGLGPPSTFWTLTFRADELLDPTRAGTQVAMIIAAIMGLHLYVAATACLWMLTLSRFRALKGPPPRVSKKHLAERLEPPS